MSKKIKLKISARILRKKSRKGGLGSKKYCRFCGTGVEESAIDYKNAEFLRSFLTERGKILPSRISGNCSGHQRLLAREIRKARTVALVPYSAN